MGTARNLRRWLWLLSTLLFCLAAPAYGQMNTAEISGLVKDPSGASVADATIEAVESNTQLKYTTVSNASGEFLLAQIPVGEYSLSVNANGFKQSAQSGIVAHAGDKLRQVISLELGDQSQVVRVTEIGRAHV
jgi:hypothetical protein